MPDLFLVVENLAWFATEEGAALTPLVWQVIREAPHAGIAVHATIPRPDATLIPPDVMSTCARVECSGHSREVAAMLTGRGLVETDM